MILSRVSVWIQLAVLVSLVSQCEPSKAAESPPNVAAARSTGPWNLSHLKTTPKFEWGEMHDGVREVYYANEPYQGKPTRVFAYYARPAKGEGPFPGMVLVHGGGGTAFDEWARLWAERGYAALAMDLAGHGAGRQRLADGGPNQTDAEKFGPFVEETVREMWSYHAVAAVIRGHSLLASLPEVDAERIGITGISWGGYLTCLVAGLDDRLKVAVPVYGCGFLHANSVWLPRFESMDSEQRSRWIENFDPSRYLPSVSCPILFVNGTNDFAYPLDSYQKSYRAVPGQRDLCVTVRMSHSHPAGWKPVEIGLFVDSVLRDGTPLPRLGPPELADGQFAAKVTSDVAMMKAQLHYTAESGPWQKRAWLSVDASLKDGRAIADLPSTRPLVAFLTVTDERGATVSTEHVEINQ